MQAGPVLARRRGSGWYVMQNLNKIATMEMVRIPKFGMDSFQEEILNNLYLEFFLEKCRVLLTPDYGYFTTGESAPEERATVEAILESSRDLLDKLKHYILYNLSLYSALLETNSYYLTLNNHLLICRFVADESHEDDFVLKLYTLSVQDIPANYRDKIYIGRDFISLKTLRRDHFGIKRIRNSLIEQFLKLKKRLAEHLPEKEYTELEKEYLQEAEETIGDFAEATNQIIETFPVEISVNSLETAALIQANMHFRELKHILIELEDSLRDLESVMFERNHARGVRYVTKFIKDVTNYINFILFKVNGRISDAINKIHV